MKSLGDHLIVELYNCDIKTINNAKKVGEILLEAVRISGAQIIKHIVHKFSPHGVSGIVAIAESHFSIHTWPEYGYCAVDIFTCGDSIDSNKALQYIKEKFSAGNISVTDMKRGVLNLSVEKIKHKPDGE